MLKKQYTDSIDLKQEIEQVDFLIESCSFLERQEPLFHKSHRVFSSFELLAEKFSLWLHWKNFFEMKLLFLKDTLKLLTHLIEISPMDPEIHGRFAYTYIKLCQLYTDPRKLRADLLWVSPQYQTPSMQQLFSKYAHLAIEQLHVLDELTPNTPWVYAELAEIYRLQENAEQEIVQYEKICNLSIHNPEALQKLGHLYFSQGHHVKGLAVYQTLQKHSPALAKCLIHHYGRLRS